MPADRFHDLPLVVAHRSRGVGERGDPVTSWRLRLELDLQRVELGTALCERCSFQNLTERFRSLVRKNVDRCLILERGGRF